MRHYLSNWGKRLLNRWQPAATALFASHCALCEGNAPGRGVCDDCWAELPWLNGPGCLRCAHPLPATGICGRCLADPPHFDQVIPATRYGFPVDSLIQSCKYGGRLSTIHSLAEMLNQHPPQSADLIVPMPLSTLRLRERGFNQTALLAAVLARVAGGDARVDAVLRRVVDTATQTALDRRSRMANLKNAFALARGAALNPHLHYVIVDDVFTTGSTLNRCAQALRRAGGLKLDVVTFGHG